MGFRPVTEDEHEAGLALGRERLARAVVAEGVRYDPAADSITLALVACEVTVPRAGIGEFAGLSAEDMARVRLSAVGDAVTAGLGDVHVDLAGLLADVLPDAAVDRAFARRGGKATSPAKAEAARANGSKGGRPRRLGAVQA
jgi:hypothetical protein